MSGADRAMGVDAARREIAREAGGAMAHRKLRGVLDLREVSEVLDGVPCRLRLRLSVNAIEAGAKFGDGAEAESARRAHLLLLGWIRLQDGIVELTMEDAARCEPTSKVATLAVEGMFDALLDSMRTSMRKRPEHRERALAAAEAQALGEEVASARPVDKHGARL